MLILKLSENAGGSSTETGWKTSLPETIIPSTGFSKLEFSINFTYNVVKGVAPPKKKAAKELYICPKSCNFEIPTPWTPCHGS